MGALRWSELAGVIVQNDPEDNARALEQIGYACSRSLPMLSTLPEFGKAKGAEPIAIVAAGPSLRYTLHMLGAFRVIMVCGSVHDFAISRGVKPSYAVLLDPALEVLNYLQRPCPVCCYLAASQCHPAVFDALASFPVALWHCRGLDGVPDGPSTIGFGSTVGLRAIGLANVLGYTEMHLFGFDSCCGEADERHAFPLADPSKEFVSGTGGDIIDLMVGKDQKNGRRFRVPKYLMAQIKGFEELLMKFDGAFNPHVHGDGVLAEMLRLYREAHR